MTREEIIEEMARALSVPQHHTPWDLLSEVEKNLYRMQADYALKSIGPDVIEALNLLVRVVDTNNPNAGLAITNASVLRATLQQDQG